MINLESVRRVATTPDDRPTLDVLEVAGLLAITLFASIGTVALVLAQRAWFGPWRAVVLGTLVAAAVSGIAVAVGGRPRLHVDRRSVVGLIAIAAVSMALFLPGFPYAFGDKDPGVYVIHGFGIERTGSIDVPDPAATIAFHDEFAELGPFGTGGRYPGLRVEDQGEVVTTSSDFFHFVPSTFAVAIGIAGTAGVFNLTPLIAVLSVLLLALAANRAFGPAVAVVASALLTTNVMQVWQAKTPSTEIPMQAVVTGALLAVVLAMSTRWSGAAFLSGILVGTAFLVRPDGFLVVALGAGLLGLTIAVRGADRRVLAAAVGAAISLPYALYNAYVLEENYVLTNGVPRWEVLAAFTTLAIGGGIAARLLSNGAHGQRVAASIQERLDGRYLGVIIVASLVVGGVLSWNRESWFGATFGEFAGRPTRSFNERNLHWMSYFVTRPGLLLIVGGVAVVAVRRRWDPRHWVLLGPGFLLLPIYIYDAKISARLMWWVRRFIPIVVPALMIALAVLVVWLLSRRVRLVAVGGAMILVALLAEFATTTRPILSHREFGGSYSLAVELAEQTADAGVVLVTPGGDIVGSTRNLPSAAWMIAGTPSTYLPSEDVDRTEFAANWDRATDGPVYLLSEDPTSLPEGLELSDWERTASIERTFWLWHETPGQRPRYAIPALQVLELWRYLPSV